MQLLLLCFVVVNGVKNVPPFPASWPGLEEAVAEPVVSDLLEEDPAAVEIWAIDPQTHAFSHIKLTSRRAGHAGMSRREFLNLFRAWHPDKNRNNDHVATEIFQFLQSNEHRIG